MKDSFVLRRSCHKVALCFFIQVHKKLSPYVLKENLWQEWFQNLEFFSLLIKKMNKFKKNTAYLLDSGLSLRAYEFFLNNRTHYHFFKNNKSLEKK